MSGTSYTVWDKHNNLGFVLDGNTASTPGVLLTQTNVTSGSVLSFLSTKGLFSEAGGSGVSGLNMPGNAHIIHLAGATATINAPVLGPVPPFTPLTFAPPLRLAIKCRDVKNLGAYYVEFVINTLGLGVLTRDVGVGIAEFGVPMNTLDSSGKRSAVYYAGHAVFVDGVVTPLGNISALTSLDTPSGNQLPFDGLHGITEGDSVSGFHIAPNTVVTDVDTNPLSPTFGFVTLNNNITGDVPVNTSITFVEVWSDGCIISMAVDLGAKFIQFRKIGGALGAVGNWSPLIDISALDIDSGSLSRGVVLLAQNGLGNGGLSISLSSAPADLAASGPMGYTPGWPDNEFSSDLGVTKVTSYVSSGPPDLAVRKMTGDVLSGPPGEAVRKLTSYAMSGPPGLAVRKLTAVLFILPTTPLPPVPILPELPPGFPVRLSIVMVTTIGSSKSLREVRVAQQPYPVWDIELTFQELRDQTQNETPYAPLAGFQQFEELCQLWLMMYGRSNIFAFDAPWDNSRANQFIGFGDGTTYIFPIFRSWGQEPLATLQPIGTVNEIFEVRVNNVIVSPAHYTFDRNKLVFQGANGTLHPPGAGLAITMTFSFFYLCHFVADEQDFEEFAKNRWTVPSLKFRAPYWP